MNTTQSDGALASRAAQAAPDAIPFGPAPTNRELALLESAHDQLLRQVQDLKRAYAAERERRARVARSTMDLAAHLARSGASSAFGSRRLANSEAVGGA